MKKLGGDMIKIGKKIKGVIERDKNIIFTTTRSPYPFVADRFDGYYAYDVEGNKYLDFSTFISIYNFGKEGLELVKHAVKLQAEKLMHSAFQDFYAELPVTAAEKLVSLLPSGFGRVFFSNSGTEANEDAIKLARLFTKRPYLLAFYNSFHGRSLGSLSMTSSKVAQRAHLGPFVGFYHAFYPNPYRCPFHSSSPEECAEESLDFIENFLFRKVVSPEEIAGIFVEPVQGEGGYIVPPKEFIIGLRKLADEHNILLIDDEIQAGLMRTGKFVAMDHFGVKADIYTFAKALGGGLPLGATVAKRSLGDTPEGSHAGTFGGNLLSIAASNALLDYIKRNRAKLEQMAARKGSMILKRLNEMRESYELVGDARGLGMMLAIELVKSKESKEPATKEREAVLNKCFEKGLILLGSGESSIRIIPAITMPEELINKGLDVLEEAIKEVSNKGA